MTGSRPISGRCSGRRSRPTPAWAGTIRVASSAATIDAYVAIIDNDPEVYRFLTSGLARDPEQPVVSLAAEVARNVAVVLGQRLRDIGVDDTPAELWAYGIVGMVHMAGDWWVDRRTFSRDGGRRAPGRPALGRARLAGRPDRLTPRGSPRVRSAAVPTRVIQWSTGNVGYHALRCIIRHPELELAGLWVHSPDKVGRDAGELADLERGRRRRDERRRRAARPRRRRASATPRPPTSGPTRPSTTSAGSSRPGRTWCRRRSCRWSTPVAATTPCRQMVDRLEAACREGGTSCFTSGIDPGFANDLLPITLHGRVRAGRLGAHPGDPRTTRPTSSPRCCSTRWASASRSTSTPLLLLPGRARLRLGWGDPDDRRGGSASRSTRSARCTSGPRSTATSSSPYGTVEAGTQAGLRFEVQGIVGGEPRIIAEHVTRLDDDGGARVAVAGRRPGLLPDHRSKGSPEPRLPARDRERGRRPQHRRPRRSPPCGCSTRSRRSCAAPPGVLSALDLPDHRRQGRHALRTPDARPSLRCVAPSATHRADFRL